MTTLKLAMQQCSKFSELNCKLWDTFLRNVDKSALGAILNQVSVNLLQLLESQPYKISKIFEYLIIQNKDQLESYFNELYFLPEHSCLQQVNQTLKKYTDVKYLLDQQSSLSVNSSASNLKSLVSLIKHYLKGSLHENADLRCKALEKLYQLLQGKCSQIIFLIQRQENSQIISEIVLALLNGCRDSDARCKLLFGCCLGEIGAIDPANVLITNTSLTQSNLSTSAHNLSNSSNSLSTLNKKSLTNQASNSINTTPVPSTSINQSLNQSASSPIINDLPSLLSEDSAEFSETFSHSLIIELSKAYLAARNTHEQDSASYAIQECLKIYGCSLNTGINTGTNNNSKVQNTKLWSSFPDYFKEILIPLRTSKYEIHTFDNLGSLKTPIIQCECKTYEEWIYKWCAYLISKIETHRNSSVSGDSGDKEMKVFPKLQFIIRFNVNVALFILPYLIIKMIIQNINNEIIDQIYDEIMSVIQLGSSSVISSSNQTQILSNSTSSIQTTNANVTNNNNNNQISSSNTANTNSKMMQYQHICCQTIFNIYDHLMRQLNYYRTKMNELQATVNAYKKNNSKNIAIMGSKSLKEASSNEMLLIKYRDFFQLFNRFIGRIPHQIISKAAFECKAYCRSLMHYELLMRNTPGAVTIQSSAININQENLIELQYLYASMDDADAASGILLLKKGSEESLGDAAFRHKINGRLNECLACIEQMLESNENAKNDIKQHENYIRTFINVGRHRNALSYLEGLMVDRPEWKEDLDSYRNEACWKLGSWDKLKQIVNSNFQNNTKEVSLMDSQLTGKDLFNIAESQRYTINNSFNAGIGKLFVLVDERNEKEFNETLRILREQQIGPLSAVSMEAGGGSYQRGYEYVVNLQALQEIESCMSEMLRLRNDTTDKEQYRNMLIKNLDAYLIGPWEQRTQTMQPSFKHNEIIYNVRIALLNFLSTHLEINVSKPQAKLWLHLAKIARKAGMFENAYQYMLNAQGQIKLNDSSNLEELLVEKSKWYWQREDKDSALFYLQKGLNELFNNDSNAVNDSTNSELYSKVLLMYTKFSEGISCFY